MEITTHGDPLKKGCVTLRCPSQCRWRLSYWQVVSSAPESNFTGRFDAVVSGAMILRHTDPQLGPIQLLCPPSAPRRTTRQIYFDRPLYCSPKVKTNGSRFEGNRPEVLISGFQRQQTNKHWRIARVYIPGAGGVVGKAEIPGGWLTAKWPQLLCLNSVWSLISK